MNEINADKFQKDLKIRKFTLGDGESVRIRMPDRSVSVEVTRDGELYRLAFVGNEPVNEELKARVEIWFSDFLERTKCGVAMDEATLKHAFDGIAQQYRKRHMPPKPVDINTLIPAPNFDTDPSDTPLACCGFSYQEVMDALSGKSRLQWGALENFGNECVKVEMPDAQTDLVIRRWHTHAGARHEVHVLAHENTSDIIVDRLRAQVNRFSEFHQTEQGGMIAEHVRNLVYKVRRLDANQEIEPAATPRSGLIEV